MEEYELTSVVVEGLPKSYILECETIDKLLLNPGRKLLGIERQRTAFDATVIWLRAMQNEGLFPEESEDICTVTVLAEAAGHNLPGALATVLSPRYQRGDNWLGVSRFALARGGQEAIVPFDAKVNYLRMHSSAPTWCLIDTIATGATLSRALEAAFANAPRPERILMATPCGSAEGARKIAAVCRNNGIDLILTHFGAIFGLWHDGTGLPWCHPKTIFSGSRRSEKNRQLAREIFNGIEGFCAVGDCSANFFAVAEAKEILAREEQEFNWKLPIDWR
ncbi:MAG TPA: hypothetical protein V6D17_22475 [Candidatus Obscuribacterales bacterium]